MTFISLKKTLRVSLPVWGLDYLLHWLCKEQSKTSTWKSATERAACYYYPRQGVSSSRLLPMGSELWQRRIKVLGHAVSMVPPSVLGNGCKPSLSSIFKSSHTCFILNWLDQTHFLLTYLFWECIIQYFCFGSIIFFHFVALLSSFKHKFTKQSWHLIPGSCPGDYRLAINVKSWWQQP